MLDDIRISSELVWTVEKGKGGRGGGRGEKRGTGAKKPEPLLVSLTELHGDTKKRSLYKMGSIQVHSQDRVGNKVKE